MENSHSHFTLSASQIRAARAILNWSQDELALKANLSIATIRKIEAGHISPRGNTNDDIYGTFVTAGLEFIEPGGVRHKPEDITIYQGTERAKVFYDDVYHTAQSMGGDLVVVSPSEDKQFTKILGVYREVHIARMTALKDKTTVKCILTEDSNSLPASSYCEYRSISKSYIDSVSFYVYGDKYAIIITDIEPFPKITVIQSRVIADAFRKQFYSMWEKATPLNRFEKPIPFIEKKRLWA